MSTVYVVCVKTLVSIALQASLSGRSYPVAGAYTRPLFSRT